MIHPLWQEIPMDMRPRVRYWLPGADIDETDLRRELQTLAARGFGGVEAVTLATLPPEITAGPAGWGTPAWERVLQILGEETAALGLRLDLAIGPAWPIAAPGIRSCNDPAALRELTYGVMPVSGRHYCGALPERRTQRSEGTPELVHVLAYRQTEDHVLRQDSYLDLTSFLDAAQASLDVTFPIPGDWLIFAFYSQPAGQTVDGGRTYVIDHLSLAGSRAITDYWQSVLPKLSLPSLESLFCDSLEYEVALEWTPEMLREFETRMGYSLLPWLPFIGQDNSFPKGDVPGYRLEDAAVSDQRRRDFSEVLTRLYCENHLLALEAFGREHGVTVRYQVAYNKPFEADRCALAVSVPENEALGRTALDYQKIMAAAAHIGKKSRHSFECAAEFGHSYGQSYEDLLWWIKRSLMSGMNAQVLHGASYSGRCPTLQPPWPGYEGFGKIVSNNWNRTPELSHARGCMDAVSRLNQVFRQRAEVDCAVYRPHYDNDGIGSEFCLYPDGGVLGSMGFSYEFLSDALVELAARSLAEGRLDSGNTNYRCLIIPHTQAMSLAMLRCIPGIARQGVPVIWVGSQPGQSWSAADWDTPEKQAAWRDALSDAWASAFHADSLTQVPGALAACGVRPAVLLEGGTDMITAVRKSEGRTYYALYRFNRAEAAQNIPGTPDFVDSSSYRIGTIQGTYRRPGLPSRKELTVVLEGTGSVWQLDPWSGRQHLLPFRETAGGKLQGCVVMEEDDLVLLSVEPGTAAEALSLSAVPVKWNCLELYPFVPDSPRETSFLRSGFGPCCKTVHLDTLAPWAVLDPSLSKFAGKGIYRGVLTLPRQDILRCTLHLGQVCDTFTLRVNGQEASFPDQVRKCADISDLIHPGENTLELTVVSSLHNLLTPENATLMGIPMPNVPRQYGLWETPEHPMFCQIAGRSAP